MYNRDDLVFGIIFIAIGIIIFFAVLLIEPLVDAVTFPQWGTVTFQIIALICVVAGIVGIITALIPRKTYDTKIELSNDKALNLLRTRYAKEEITKEQYEQMKKI